MRDHIALLAIAAAICCTFASATAHDIPGLFHQGIYDPVIIETGQASNKLAHAIATKTLAPDAGLSLKSVILTAATWSTPHALSVCFLSGSPSLRTRVVNAITAAWPLSNLTHGQLTYDRNTFLSLTPPLCGSESTDADIRIGFLSDNANYGYWSYIGKESRQYYPSMNFSNFDNAPPSSTEFDEIVAHEMGHALGLEHEHQSPQAPNCKWNYPKIFKDYSWQSYADMLGNFRKLQNIMNGPVPTYQVSMYDAKSIMHYYFEPPYFTDGDGDPCYIPEENRIPSPSDLAAITLAYPSSNTASKAELTELKTALKSRIILESHALYKLLKHKLFELSSK